MDLKKIWELTVRVGKESTNDYFRPLIFLKKALEEKYDKINNGPKLKDDLNP